MVPIGRELFRTAATHIKNWGEPVVLIGYGPDGKTVLEFLLKNPKVGLLPKAVIQTGGGGENVPDGILVIQSQEILTKSSRSCAQRVPHRDPDNDGDGRNFGPSGDRRSDGRVFAPDLDDRNFTVRQCLGDPV